MSEKIAIALSGGVDSLVAASILLDEGRDIFGVHFVTNGGKAPDRNHTVNASETCWSSDMEALVRASGLLGIRLISIDLSEAFTEEVVKGFVYEYARGRTPNPCCACNRKIKFGRLLEKVSELGATHLATGHYATVENNPVAPRLLKGLDPIKDQSYFLSMVGNEALSRTLFPLGRLTKTEVREMAKKRGIAPLVKDESQDICFAQDGDYRKILSDWNMASGPGPIVDLEGKALGTHSGLFAYTVGQRRGMGVAASRPLYVVRLEPSSNTLVVGYEEDIMEQIAHVSDINWICPPPLEPVMVEARIRYRSRPTQALLTPIGAGHARLNFSQPVKAVTPGQTAAFYRGDLVLGGGIID